MILSRPSLSVVVPVLNEQACIAAALDALNAQRKQPQPHPDVNPVELLVVDGGSRDDSVALSSSRADRVITSAAGRGRQLNAGAAQTSGDILLFVHADSELPPAALATVQKQLADHPAALWGRFDVKISGRSRMFPLIAALMNLRSAWTGIATGDQAMFVRRDSFDAVGGFPDQALMEDIELSKRLRRLPGGKPLRIRDRVLTSGRRWESRGVWTTILLMWRLRWRYWRGTPADVLAKAYR